MIMMTRNEQPRHPSSGVGIGPSLHFHTWLCHNEAVDACKRFGITLNRNGFIDSFVDAVRVTENLKASGAEPPIWEPWLVEQYGC
jgi:hypothetical protein